MRRADRFFQIVQFLRDGRLTTAAKLSEKLEVSERTIYRDIADLIGTGVPIDGEAGVGYIMREGYDLPPLMFTRSEIVALTAGARLIRAWGGTAMAEAAEEALVKSVPFCPRTPAHVRRTCRFTPSRCPTWTTPPARAWIH
jgi:predicted DNA-binding transcriptional regulator YafY